MKQLRTRVILLACWLIAFYNMAHFWRPFKISPITYLFLPVLVIVVLITPRLMRVKLWWTLSITTFIYIVIKLWMELPLAGIALPVFITETLAIILTALLVLWVCSAILEFENAVAQITIGRRDKITESATEGQSILYREVRRARNHQRPLVLLAVAVDEKSFKGAMNRMVKDAQQSMIKQFTLASISRSLCEKLEDCDIVVQTNEHFLIVLPETKLDDLPRVVDRIRRQVAEQVGVDLKIGAASLPKDGFTFEGLIDKAVQDMQKSDGSEVFAESERAFAKHELT